MTQIATVILAAGQGTRMRSKLPKVLHPLAGQAMATYPLQVAEKVGSTQTVVVVGHGAEAVKGALRPFGVNFVLQEQQLGTGHALLMARDALDGFTGTLLLLCGDVPLLREETVRALLEQHQRQQATVSVLTANMDNPYGYGRIVRRGDEVVRIVEEKDATPAERELTEINTGIYAFEAPAIFELLENVDRDNAQGEYYLTDSVAAAQAAGLRVGACIVDDPREAMGINDRVQLAEAEAIMRRRINRSLMRSGVTIIDPEATYIDATVEIGTDSVIHPGSSLRGDCNIGSDCSIGPHTVVTDSCLADRVNIKAGCVVSDAKIGSDTDVGPMAHLRPGTVLAGENKIGNFVETKKAEVGFGSKASHLTYLGDCELGKGVNIGCGTITCNYDGVNKHRTVIEDDVFVGSDTQFVAPVTIGRNSLIGAGSTITKDVPADALAITRAEQKNIAGWAKRKRKKLQKSEG